MKVNYIQSYSPEFKLSERLNDVIDPLEGWICLTDCDTLKFPGFQENLINVIESVNNEYALIGPMTNRLSRKNPAVIHPLYFEDSITEHFKFSHKLWKDNGPETKQTNVIAGNCMIFHKSLWLLVGGFDPSTIFFDKYFSYRVKEVGGTCLLALGLYIFHLYRWGEENPEEHVMHLIKKAPKN